MTTIKKPSRPIVSKGNQVYNKYVLFLRDNKCFLNYQETVSNFVHLFIWNSLCTFVCEYNPFFHIVSHKI